MQGLRQDIRRGVQSVSGSLLASDVLAGLTGGEGAVILMYHSVAERETADWVCPAMRVEPQLFEQQMRFLAKRRRVVSMTELVATIERGVDPARGTVVITFDDGYLDNLRVAAPVLGAFGLPAIVYLPTAFIDGAAPQWVDELWGIIATRRSDILRLSVGCGEWRVGSRPETVVRAVNAYFVEAGLEERDRLLAEARESLRPDASAPRLTMTWEDVRRLVVEFPAVELGGHTRNHIDLRRWTGDVARTEIASCRLEAMQHTGRDVAHFSFPYGRSSDETRRVVSDCGFRSAVAVGDRMPVRAGSDLMKLPRVDGRMSLGRLRHCTSGLGRAG